MNPPPLFQILVMYINHIWAANLTDIVPESQNKDEFYLQPLFKARDLPHIDAVHRKYETMPHEDYQVLGKEIYIASENRVNRILRKKSHRISRSTSLRTYPNRVTYVASSKGKMARLLFIFCEIYPNRNPSNFEISEALYNATINKIFQQLLLYLMPFPQSKWFHA